jgi:hypothetical protein
MNLRAAIKQLGKRLAAIWSDPDPGQLSTQPGDLVAAPRQVFLGSEQIEPRFQPLLACHDRMCRHPLSPFAVHGADRVGLLGVDREIDLVPASGRLGVTSVSGFEWTR